MEKTPNTENPFREFHNSFRPTGRMFFRSKWWTTISDSKSFVVHVATYRKPVVESEVKGKWQRKAAKRHRRDSA